MQEIFEKLNKINDYQSLNETSVAVPPLTPAGISTNIEREILALLHSYFSSIEQVYNKEVMESFNHLRSAVNMLYAEHKDNLQLKQKEQEDEERVMSRLRNVAQKQAAKNTTPSDTTSIRSRLKKTFSDLDI